MKLSAFWGIIDALHEGRELANPETYKRFGVLTNVFGVIVASLIGLVPDLYVGDVDQKAIVEGLATLAFVINGYLHVATTKKIGLKVKE